MNKDIKDTNNKNNTNNIKKVELLAPAGTYNAFMAAIENGADAVYLGGKQLNARQFAGNFDDEELERALDYAHVRGAKIFLTMNTLVLDSEMQEALQYAGKVFEMGVDAFIVQDMGFAANLKRMIPQISLHGSTQMTIYSAEGVKTLESMGFDRAVLARELSLEEIQILCSRTEIETEVFVHGALCICYSGQCLMSSIIGGRSGNRGKCAQPCRLPYEIHRDKKRLADGYLMSPKDICFIEQLYDLIRAGVVSFKIEGRMKSPEYVASVVGTYRKYLDIIAQSGARAAVSKEDFHKLVQSFNRGGFSRGYLLGKTGPEMMAYQKPKNWGTVLGTVLAQDKSTNSVKIKLDNAVGNGDGIEIWTKDSAGESPGGIITKIISGGKQVKRAMAGDSVWVSVIRGKVEKGNKVYKTSDREMLEQAAASYAKSSKKAAVIAHFMMKDGQLPALTLSDDNGNSVTAKGELLPQKAINKPLTDERIAEQLDKMGATPFHIVQLSLDTDGDLVLPVSELNNLRRQAAEMLEKKRILSAKRKLSAKNDENYQPLLHFPGNSCRKKGPPRISIMLYDIQEGLDLKKIDADRLYIPFTDLLRKEVEESSRELRSSGKEIFVWIPAAIKGKYTEIIQLNAQKLLDAVDGWLVGNIAAARLIQDILPGKDIRMMGDYTLNVMNHSSLSVFKEFGYEGAALSYELNLSQIDEMRWPQDFTIELGLYGKIPVMTSEYCPIGSSVAGKSPAACKLECKKGVHHLRDRKGADFLVQCDCIDCRSTLFNSNVLFAPELVKKVCNSGVEYLRLSFIDESPEEIYNIVALHRALIQDRPMQSQDDIIAKIKAKGFTKGHLQRGV